MARGTVKTSEMALDILEYIAFADNPPIQAEIAAAVGIVKSAVHKHLHTLGNRNYVVRNPVTSTYTIGPTLWLIGNQAADIEDLAKVAEAHMLAVRNATGLAVVLSSVTGAVLSVISEFHGTHAIEIGVRRGSKLSLHASAQGHVALAFGPANIFEQVCSGPLAALTPKTIVSPDLLGAQISICREHGYAVAPEQTLLGVNALAAPIFGQRDELIGTVALIGSIQHLPAVLPEEHVATIRKLASDIERYRGQGLNRTQG